MQDPVAPLYIQFDLVDSGFEAVVVRSECLQDQPEDFAFLAALEGLLGEHAHVLGIAVPQVFRVGMQLATRGPDLGELFDECFRVLEGTEEGDAAALTRNLTRRS
ncbi:MAG: hypothetical protein HS122_18130 [Opitutaceae bacterium]|nr:hypothetical protein [Opitutaceae bacterium]